MELQEVSRSRSGIQLWCQKVDPLKLPSARVTGSTFEAEPWPISEAKKSLALVVQHSVTLSSFYFQSHFKLWCKHVDPLTLLSVTVAGSTFEAKTQPIVGAKPPPIFEVNCSLTLAVQNSVTLSFAVPPVDCPKGNLDQSAGALQHHERVCLLWQS